jgi:hypothetical protein
MASSTEVAPYLAKRLSLIVAKHTIGDTTTTVNDDSSSKVVVTVTPKAGGEHHLVFSMDLTEIPQECCGIAAIVYITIVHSHMLRPISPQLDAKDSKKLQTMIKYFASVDPAIFETGGVESEEEEEEEEDEEETDEEDVDTQFSIIKKGTCKVDGSASAEPLSPIVDNTNYYQGAKERPEEESNGNEDGNGDNTPAGTNTGVDDNGLAGNTIPESKVSSTPPIAINRRNDPNNKIETGTNTPRTNTRTNTPRKNGAGNSVAGNQPLARATTNSNNGSTVKAATPATPATPVKRRSWFDKLNPFS